MTVIAHGLKDAAVIVLGHGSTKNSDSCKPVFQHVEGLRRRGHFAAVRAGFWKQEPHIGTVLAELNQPRVFIVPLFISEGYFSESVIPSELGFRTEAGKHYSRVLQRASQTWYYCRPVGTHEGMTGVILGLADAITAQYPFPRLPLPGETTLFIAGHGTAEDADSRESIDRQVEHIRDLQKYAAVHPLFLEDEPLIATCYETARTRHIVIVPFFVSDGLHAQEDIPVMLGESERLVKDRLERGKHPWRNPTERHGKLVWYTPSIGSEPHLTDIIVDLICGACLP